MKNRTLLFLLLANSLVGVALAVWVNVFTASELIDRLKTVGLYDYRGCILLGFVVLSLVLLVLIFRRSHDHSLDEAKQPAKVSEAHAKKASSEFLQDLDERFQIRYQNKLYGRFEISLCVSEDLNSTLTLQFDEESGADSHEGKSVQYIIEQFEKKGRLLIVGSPGAGKTLLLLKLARHLVGKAKRDPRHPLPVIFNLASWSSDYELFDDWLKATLTQGYGLSSDFAAAMLRDRRIVFLLDGLDELARNEDASHATEIRTACLAALNNYLCDGAMNAVICCRREEFGRMQRRGAEIPVAARVSVQDLTEGQIRNALIKATNSEKDRFAAQNLLAALAQDSSAVYRQVLTTPFYFTMALQVFDYSKPPSISAPDKETLETSLVVGFVRKRLRVTENARRFRDAKTLNWLTWLAVFLETRQLVVFELADLQQDALKETWLYKGLIRVVGAVLFGVILSVFFVALFGEQLGLLITVQLGLVTVLLALIIGSGRGKIETQDLSKWTLSSLRRGGIWLRILRFAMIGAGVFSAIFLVIALVFGWMLEVDLFVGMPFAVISISGFLVFGIGASVGACRQISGFAKISGPYQRLRAGLVFFLLAGGCVTAFMSLGWQAMAGWPSKEVDWLYVAGMFITGSFVALPSAPLFKHCLLRLCLTLEGSTPARYVAFLRYATDLCVLEQDGGQWRFRHQNLQNFFTRRDWDSRGT